MWPDEPVFLGKSDQKNPGENGLQLVKKCKKQICGNFGRFLYSLLLVILDLRIE